MILGNLELLCLAVFVLLLILLAALAAVSLLNRVNRSRVVPERLLTNGNAAPVTLDTVFKLNYYYPLPDGFAYTEDETGAPTIVRIEDGLSLPYTVSQNRLTFEEPYLRPDGTVTTCTHEVYRRSKPAYATEATSPKE